MHERLLRGPRLLRAASPVRRSPPTRCSSPTRCRATSFVTPWPTPTRSGERRDVDLEDVHGRPRGLEATPTRSPARRGRRSRSSRGRPGQRHHHEPQRLTDGRQRAPSYRRILQLPRDQREGHRQRSRMHRISSTTLPGDAAVSRSAPSSTSRSTRGTSTSIRLRSRRNIPTSPRRSPDTCRSSRATRRSSTCHVWTTTAPTSGRPTSR